MDKKKSNRRKIEDLLPQLDGKVLIFKDFTTILEKGRDERREIIAQFRECYDGSFAKKVGTVDKTISYVSRFGLIAGVTSVIDKHWKIMQQLGERFIKVRWKENPDLVTKRSRENESYEKSMRKELVENSNKFISNNDFNKIPNFDDNHLGDFVSKIAKFIAHARTPISFNENSDEFYFEYIPTPEMPTRLVKQLKKLSKCLALIRGKAEVSIEEIQTLLRVAKDTIPQDRLAILQIIHNFQNQSLLGCPRAKIYIHLKIPKTSIRRVLSQLGALNLLTVKEAEDEFEEAGIKKAYYHTTALWDDIFGTMPEKSGDIISDMRKEQNANTK